LVDKERGDRIITKNLLLASMLTTSCKNRAKTKATGAVGLIKKFECRETGSTDVCRMNIRKACVAGQFYPADPESLHYFVKKTLLGETEKRQAKGLLVPHAGYPYSGETAGKTYDAVELTGKAVILCPNHTGMGAMFSVMKEGCWETPLGKVPVAEDLAGDLLQTCRYLKSDESAHQFEHAVEVQLPFLQCLKPDIRFVPIAIGGLDFLKLRALGEAMAEVIKQHGPVQIIASGDMNHYENEKTTQEKDKAAIQAMLDLDEDRLVEEAGRRNISMCGLGPAYAMLVAVKQLGAREAFLVEHATSARASGDFSRVVGYAGMIFY